MFMPMYARTKCHTEVWRKLTKQERRKKKKKKNTIDESRNVRARVYDINRGCGDTFERADGVRSTISLQVSLHVMRLGNYKRKNRPRRPYGDRVIAA